MLISFLSFDNGTPNAYKTNISVFGVIFFLLSSLFSGTKQLISLLTFFEPKHLFDSHHSHPIFGLSCKHVEINWLSSTHFCRLPLLLLCVCLARYNIVFEVLLFKCHWTLFVIIWNTIFKDMRCDYLLDLAIHSGNSCCSWISFRSNSAGNTSWRRRERKKETWWKLHGFILNYKFSCIRLCVWECIKCNMILFVLRRLVLAFKAVRRQFFITLQLSFYSMCHTTVAISCSLSLSLRIPLCLCVLAKRFSNFQRCLWIEM